MVYDSYGLANFLQPFHGKAIAIDVNHENAPLPLLLLVHEHIVRGRNFFQPTPNVEVTNGWQEWVISDGVVDEKDDGSFTFNCNAPTPAKRTKRLQLSSTTAPPSGFRTVILPPTEALVEDLLAYQHTTPSWKAWQRGG